MYEGNNGDNNLNDSITIQIPKDLYEKILGKIKGTSYNSVEEYIISRLENEFPREHILDAKEERIIRERLRLLGYIE